MCRYIFIAWSNGPHLLAQLFHSRDAHFDGKSDWRDWHPLLTAMDALATAANENVKPEESTT